jgi:hypothetical protein
MVALWISVKVAFGIFKRWMWFVCVCVCVCVCVFTHKKGGLKNSFLKKQCGHISTCHPRKEKEYPTPSVLRMFLCWALLGFSLDCLQKEQPLEPQPLGSAKASLNLHKRGPCWQAGGCHGSSHVYLLGNQAPMSVRRFPQSTVCTDSGGGNTILPANTGIFLGHFRIPCTWEFTVAGV